MSIARTSSLLLLSLALGVGGCPKKKIELDEEAAADPVENFQAGVESLVPDRKGNVDYGAAYDFFKQAADLSGSKTAQFNAGWTAERLGRLDLAELHYRKAFEKDPSYEPAMYSLARVLKTAGKADQIPGLYETLLEANPDAIEVREEYMASLVDAKRFDDAIAQGQAILRKNPKSDDVYRSMSALYLAQSRLPMAQIMGDKALELNDADPDIYNNMGVVALQNGNLPEAIDKFQMARKLDSAHFESNVNLGLIALDAGDYELAKTCFDAALGVNPGSYEARMGQAISSRGLKDYDTAGKLYDQLIADFPDADEPYFNAATLYERYTKDFDKALKYLEDYKTARAGKIGPNDAVFARITAVQDAKAAEEERKRLEAERKKAEEERKRRARELLAAMETQVMELNERLSANSSCLPEEVTMEVEMALETAADVVAAEDTEMASDVQSMLNDYYVPMLDDAIAAGCGGPPPAEEPMEGDDGAMDEATEGETAVEGETAEAPVEEAAAEPAGDEAAAEEPAAEEAPVEEAAAEEPATEEPPADGE